MLQCAGVFAVKLRIVMCPIIGDGVMFDDGQRQLDPQYGPPSSLPTISPLRIALRTRHTSPLSQSDLVPWHSTAFAAMRQVGLRRYAEQSTQRSETLSSIRALVSVEGDPTRAGGVIKLTPQEISKCHVTNSREFVACSQN